MNRGSVAYYRTTPERAAAILARGFSDVDLISLWGAPPAIPLYADRVGGNPLAPSDPKTGEHRPIFAMQVDDDAPPTIQSLVEEMNRTANGPPLDPKEWERDLPYTPSALYDNFGEALLELTFPDSVPLEDWRLTLAVTLKNTRSGEVRHTNHYEWTREYAVPLAIAQMARVRLVDE